MLELTSPDSQRLLTFPLKVVVVGHEVDVRHRDVVILGDWAGGKPGEPAHRQLWLGRDESKGRFCLLVGIWGQGCGLSMEVAGRSLQNLTFLHSSWQNRSWPAMPPTRRTPESGQSSKDLIANLGGENMNRFGQGHSPGIVTKRVKAADPAKRGPLVHRV